MLRVSKKLCESLLVWKRFPITACVKKKYLLKNRMLNQPFKLRDLNENMKSSWLKQRGNWMMSWQKTFLT